jgi:hypothetical protein
MKTTERHENIRMKMPPTWPRASQLTRLRGIKNEMYEPTIFLWNREAVFKDGADRIIAAQRDMKNKIKFIPVKNLAVKYCFLYNCLFSVVIKKVGL